MVNMPHLQRVLGYEFTDPLLLTRALTHRSAGGLNNERLEFLGDSIVNHIIAESLYIRFPRASEGAMSRMRASLVKGDTLAELAREMDIGPHLALGPGERKSGGHRRASILADALEAIVGAILLDSDVEQCRACVLRWFAPRLEQLGADADEKDAKTRLQEYLQARGQPLPVYELTTVDGEDHSKQFSVTCRLNSPSLLAEGTGSSRRKAEQAAARSALETLAQYGR